MNRLIARLALLLAVLHKRKSYSKFAKTQNFSARKPRNNQRAKRLGICTTHRASSERR